MSHKRVSGLAALSFLIIIQAAGGVFRYLFFLIALLTILLLAYNTWHLLRNKIFTIWNLVRMFFFIISLVSIYFIVPNDILKELFLLFSSLLFYFIELNIKVFSEQLIFLETLLSYFGFSLGIFALIFYFLTKSTFILLLICLGTYFISRSSLDYIPQSPQKKNFYALLISLAILEIGWSLLLLPFHFTALAVIMFNVFYVLWIIVYYHLFNNLSLKKVSFHVIFSSILIILTFLSTPK